MRIPYVTQGNVRTHDQTLGYLHPAQVDYAPLVNGLSQMAAGFKTAADKAKIQTDQINNYKAIGAFADFQSEADAKILYAKRETPINDANVEQRLNDQYDNYEKDFLGKVSNIDPVLVPKFQAEAAAVRSRYYADHAQFAQTQRDEYYKTDINKAGNDAKVTVAEKPLTLQDQKDLMDARIDASGFSEEQKRVAKEANAKQLETIVYGKRAEQQLTYGSDLKTAIFEASKELGTSPEDFATFISFETAGTFSTSIKGGKGGQYLGLIQFGPAEQIKYGVKPGQSPMEQMHAVVQYLKDRGFKPGMSKYDLYSTINAGEPGHYNASDAANGGTPGSVVDKVNNQMGDHRKKAVELLGGKFVPPDNLDQSPDFTHVSYEDRVAARKDAEVNVNQMIAEQKRVATDHYKALVDSVKTDTYDGKIGRQQLEQMLHDNQLEFSDFGSAMEIYNKREAEGKDARDGLDMISRGIPFSADSADDLKKADAVYGKPLQEALRQGNENAQTTLVNFAGSTGIIPPKGIDALSAVASGPDAKQKLKALDVLTNLEDAANYGYNKQVPEALRHQVDRYNVLKSIMTPEELLAAISPGYTVEQRQAKDQLEKTFNQAMADPNNSLYRTFDSVLKNFDPGMFSAAPADMNYGPAVVSMHSQWNELMKYNFVKTNGNMDATVAISNKQLARIWDITEVGGKRKLMAYPVEKFVRPVDGSHAWIDEQIKTDFKIPPGTNYELVADHETENSLANPTSSHQAVTNEMKTTTTPNMLSYKVATEKDGVWSLLPGRYAPQITDRMRAGEEARTNVRLDIQRLQEMQTQYDNAYELQATKNIPIPDQLITDMETLQKKIDHDTTQLDKPVQGPKYQIRLKNSTPVNPMPQRKQFDQKVQELIKKIPPLSGAHFSALPLEHGFWQGDSFFKDEAAVPEGATVQDAAGSGWIKQGGKMVKQ